MVAVAGAGGASGVGRGRWSLVGDGGGGRVVVLVVVSVMSQTVGQSVGYLTLAPKTQTCLHNIAICRGLCERTQVHPPIL